MNINEFSPEGRGHRILRLLAQAPHTRAAIVAGPDKKAPYVLGALQRFCLIDYSGGVYKINSFGELALSSLDAGNPVQIRDVQPGARVFGQQGAGGANNLAREAG